MIREAAQRRLALHSPIQRDLLVERRKNDLRLNVYKGEKQHAKDNRLIGCIDVESLFGSEK